MPTAEALPSNKILVVEDDRDIREALIAVLADEGYSVAGAANGREGLQALARERPGLILLDLMMPVMSGAEFLAHLRREGTRADIPVVIVSAWPKDAREIEGTQGFVPKPVDLGQLLGAVERFCGAGRPG